MGLYRDNGKENGNCYNGILQGLWSRAEAFGTDVLLGAGRD